jgi:Domain of unknown function (DUF4253)
VRLTLIGAVNRTIDAEGLRWAQGYDGENFNNLPDVFAQRRGEQGWRLTAGPPSVVIELDGTKEPTLGDLRMSFGEKVFAGKAFVWEGLPNTGTVTFSPWRVDADATLTLWQGTQTIQVKGTIEAYDRDTAPTVDPRVLELLSTESRAVVRRFSTWEFGREEDARALSVIVPAVTADPLVQRLRARLGPGWSAWRGTTRFVDEDDDFGVEVVVGAGHSFADIIRQAHVDPANFDLNEQDVVEQLDAWHRAIGIDVLHADTESVTLQLARVPADVDAFAAQVHAFCPDLVDQNLGSMVALVELIRERQPLPLWWD